MEQEPGKEDQDEEKAEMEGTIVATKIFYYHVVCLIQSACHYFFRTLCHCTLCHSIYIWQEKCRLRSQSLPVCDAWKW